jgi:hypothetical protein
MLRGTMAQSERSPISWLLHIVLLVGLAIVCVLIFLRDIELNGRHQSTSELILVPFFVVYALFSTAYVWGFGRTGLRVLLSHGATWGTIAVVAVAVMGGFQLKSQREWQERRERAAAAIKLVSWQVVAGSDGPGWCRITIEAGEEGYFTPFLMAGMGVGDEEHFLNAGGDAPAGPPIRLRPGERHVWEVNMDRLMPGTPIEYIVWLDGPSNTRTSFKASTDKATPWQEGDSKGLQLEFEPLH